MKKIDLNKIKFSEILNEYFFDWWINYDKYLYKVCKGGRNSGKSTHIPFRWVRDIIKYPINGLIVRKVANTLSNSVFENMLEAIEILNVDHYFKDYKSPLKIVYKPTGQQILFRGADDPQKIKSIKTSKFPIAKLWIEELAEFKTEDEVRMIINSILRAELKQGMDYSIDLSYNPAKRKKHWCNRLYNTKFIPSNTYVHHSTYLNNPYTSQDFINEAEEIKKINYNKYRWIYLGHAIGGGITPFSNLDFDTKISNDMIKFFDNIRQGLDFGWSINPTHFVRLHYDTTRDIIYLLDEIEGIKLRNKNLYDKIVSNKYHYMRITGDSADPRGIEELQSYGLKVKGAKKGPNSIEYGLEWLDSLNKIVIDYKRTPKTAKNFEDIDYKLDKDGELTDELDGEHDAIDATRYALERDMKHIRKI